jgi:hypothetical protein
MADGTFSVSTRDGTTVTVVVDSTTAYFGAGVRSPTVADIKVGEHVAVFGTDHSQLVTAGRVAIGKPPFGGRRRPDRPPATRTASTSP